MEEKQLVNTNEDKSGIKGFSKDAKLLEALIMKMEDLEKGIKEIKKNPITNPAVNIDLSPIYNALNDLDQRSKERIIVLTSKIPSAEVIGEKLNRSIENYVPKNILKNTELNSKCILQNQDLILIQTKPNTESLLTQNLDNIIKHFCLYCFTLLLSILVFMLILKSNTILENQANYEQMLKQYQENTQPVHLNKNKTHSSKN